jgi:stage V sporulation protein SpoVS
MYRDSHGLAVTAASECAVRTLDHAVLGYLTYRADLPDRLRAVFAADPELGMAHCLKGYLAMLGYKQVLVPAAAEAAADARRLTVHATSREQAHVAALGAWATGQSDRAVAIWEEILVEDPRDLLAFRLAHFVNFWRGRPDLMLASVLGVERHWTPALPGWVSPLGLPLLRARGKRPLHRGRGRRPRRDRA